MRNLSLTSHTMGKDCIHREMQRTQNRQTTLEKKVEGVAPPDFNVIIKLQISRQCGISVKIDKQINGTAQSPKVDPHQGQMIFNKGAKAIQKRKDHFLHK